MSKVIFPILGELSLTNPMHLDMMEMAVKNARKQLASVGGSTKASTKKQPRPAMDAIILLGAKAPVEGTNMDKVVAVFEKLEAKTGPGTITRKELITACKNVKKFPTWLQKGGVSTALNDGHLMYG